MRAASRKTATLLISLASAVAAATTSVQAQAACEPGASTVYSGAAQSRPAAYERQLVRETASRIGRIENELEMRGCDGSVTVYYGPDGDMCAGLVDDLIRLEFQLRDAISRRDAALRASSDKGMGADCRPVLETADARASHSQFRDQVAVGSIAAPQARSERQEQQGSIQVVSTGPSSEAMARVAEPGPAQDMDPDRNIRVVGPRFLPDQSEAIDLTSPDHSFFR